jgi:1,4-alpha-glucan branching enzyme
MGIQKKHFKKNGVCKVTFTVPVVEDSEVRKVHVVGEFNNWSTSATPMKRSKNGKFTTSLELKSGQEYQFRYLLDNTRWENDPEADKSAATPFGDARNSVIVI